MRLRFALRTARFVAAALPTLASRAETVRMLIRFPFKRLLRDGAYVAVFNVICALMVTYVIDVGDSFGRSLVYSMSIGMIAFLVIDCTRFFLWGESGRPNWLVFTLLIAVAVLVAEALGTTLAAWLLGQPKPGLANFSHLRGIGFTLVASTGATIFFSNRERLMQARADAASERARAEQVERQALQAQLQLLQAQLEPHMLFNTLANVQGLIAIDPARAQHMLDQLIQFLRSTLTSSRAQSTTLAREFALIEAYLGLMQVRMGERLSFSLDLPPELFETPVPPMLLQPLVENAIAHGLEPKLEGGRIEVRARRDGEAVVLTVADTGRGLDAPPAKPGTHVGLANTRERLRAMYGERASLSLEPAAPCGAVATILLPA
jgi:signal transduction histidine kinase